MKLSILIPGLIWPDIGDIDYLYPTLKIPNFNSLIKHSNLLLLEHSYSDISFSVQYSNNLNLDNNSKIAEQIAKNNGLTKFKYHLIAEPTHLRVDRDRLLISEPGLLQLNKDEVSIIIDKINSHFAGEIELYNITDELWILGIDLDVSKIQFYPTLDIIGENIDNYLAYGENSIQLNKILNEIQMLLFKLDINYKRQKNGLLSVNSLWLWDKKANLNLIKKIEKYINNISGTGSVKLPNLKKIEFLTNGLNDKSFNNKLLIIDHLYAACKYRDHHFWTNGIEEFDLQLGSILNKFYKQNKIKHLNIFMPLIDKTLQLHLSRMDKYKFWKNTSLIKIVKEYISEI